MDRVTFNLEANFDRNQALTEDWILIDVILGLPFPVRQVLHTRTRELLNVVLDFRKGGPNDVDSILIAEALNLTLCQARGLGLCLQVTDNVLRCTRVARNQMSNVGKVAILVPHANRRDAKPLTHVVESLDVEGSRYRAANVCPVPVGLGKSEQLAVIEDRANHTRVVEVRATSERIVDNENVASIDVIAKRVDHGLCCEMQCADVSSDITGALHDGVAIWVAERR